MVNFTGSCRENIAQNFTCSWGIQRFTDIHYCLFMYRSHVWYITKKTTDKLENTIFKAEVTSQI